MVWFVGIFYLAGLKISAGENIDLRQIASTMDSRFQRLLRYE